MRSPRSRKDKGYVPRAKSFSVLDLKRKRTNIPLLLKLVSSMAIVDHKRPKKRRDCINGLRPCPYVGCRYHLFLDVSSSGSLILNFPDKDVWEIGDTCALDVADQNCKSTLEEVGMYMNFTRERARQIEKQAMTKIREELREAREMGKELERMRDRRKRLAR